MSKPTDIERVSQNRVVKLFKEELNYTYLGDWEEREGNSNIEEEYLTNYLKHKGYSDGHISKAIFELQQVATNFSDSLYTTNKNVYSKLRNERIFDNSAVGSHSHYPCDRRNASRKARKMLLEMHRSLPASNARSSGKPIHIRSPQPLENRS